MKLQNFLLRYSLMVILGVFLSVFYNVFTPLTIYPLAWLLSIFFNTSISGNILNANTTAISIIGACVAGSAYYLLFILNMSTPGINLGKRLFIFLADSFVFLACNILRIFILAVLLVNNSEIFDTAHLFFWYFVSIILVAAIWLATIKIFKIKSIPFVSDFKSLRKKLR